VAVAATSLFHLLSVAQIRTVLAPALDEQRESQPAGKPDEKAALLESLRRTFPRASRTIEASARRAHDDWYGLFGAREATTAAARRRALLLGACMALLALGLLATVFEMIGVYLTQYLGQAVLRGVRQSVFEHLQTQPLSYFENQRSGDLISRLTNDTTVLQGLFSAPVTTMLSSLPTALGMVVYMFILSWRLAMVVFVMLPVIALLVVVIGGRLRRQARTVQQRMADLVAFIEQTLTGMRVIQAFGMETVVDGMFGKANDGVFRSAVRMARLRALNVPASVALPIVGLVVSLLVGGNEIISGRMAGGSSLVAFVFAMLLLGTHIAHITRLNLVLQHGAASCGRLWEVLDTPSQMTDAPDAVELARMEGRIEFRGVSLVYDEEAGPVLHNLSLTVRPGEVVAFAGPSGAGKTSLVNLVPRLYDVSAGEVLVDGHDVRQVTRASLRGFMGIVPQDTVLFATSVRENIAYGRSEATEEEIVAAAQAAQAHEFVQALPQGYDTEIGERGAKLSGGQRQRIAIARALLRDPRVLILDEATSSLDAESESAVQAAIARLLEGRTALIVAHRLSTIRNADRIVVLERGRIVEEGSHDQLMAAGGLYRALYETQLREESRAGTPALEQP
jgi:subfamily B ATP-binding cassette protein MsbA